jgi:hypothetical protein
MRRCRTFGHRPDHHEAPHRQRSAPLPRRDHPRREGVTERLNSPRMPPARSRLKLPGGRAEHEVTSRAIVKGEVAPAAHSTAVSGRDDNAFASIVAKDRN